MPTLCPLCLHVGRDELRPAGSRDYHYLVCRTCGAGQIDPMPDDLRSLYDQGYFVDGGSRAGYANYEADEELHRRTATERIARLTATLGPGARPGSLVEIGSATGFGLLEAQRAGWQAVGVEISEWAGNRARERGANVVHTLEEVPDAPHDAVAFFQSLEHLPDPVAALKRSAELLRPGGVLVCETWDARSRTARLTGSRWQQLSPPSVLWLFTEQAIRAAVEPWGLELTSWRRTGKSVSLATVVGQSLPDGSRAKSLLDGRLGRVAIPYPLDDLVTFTAVRRS